MDPVNILMVDDQPAKLLAYEAMLDELGENLIKAHTAREALAVLLQDEVAVILMDVSMMRDRSFDRRARCQAAAKCQQMRLALSLRDQRPENHFNQEVGQQPYSTYDNR